MFGTLNETVGDFIRKLRKKKKITQEILAYNAGYQNVKDISYIENNKRLFLSNTELSSIASALGLDKYDEEKLFFLNSNLCSGNVYSDFINNQIEKLLVSNDSSIYNDPIVRFFISQYFYIKLFNFNFEKINSELYFNRTIPQWSVLLCLPELLDNIFHYTTVKIDMKSNNHNTETLLEMFKKIPENSLENIKAIIFNNWNKVHQNIDKELIRNISSNFKIIRTDMPLCEIVRITKNNIEKKTVSWTFSPLPRYKALEVEAFKTAHRFNYLYNLILSKRPFCLENEGTPFFVIKGVKPNMFCPAKSHFLAQQIHIYKNKLIIAPVDSESDPDFHIVNHFIKTIKIPKSESFVYYGFICNHSMRI